MTQSFYIPLGKGLDRSRAVNHVYKYLASLSPDCPWVVMATEKKPTRTNQQNALLWALYDDIIDIGGETLGGWTNKDLHEHFLIERFGSIKLHALGRTKLKPARRSSRMSKTEFSEFVDFIVRYMAEHGVVLQLPGEMAA